MRWYVSAENYTFHNPCTLAKDPIPLQTAPQNSHMALKATAAFHAVTDIVQADIVRLAELTKMKELVKTEEKEGDKQ